MRTRVWVVVLLVTAVLILTGCVRDTFPARFLRYEKATDGETYAVVALSGDGDQVRAYCRRTDLKPEQSIRVEFIGRSWDVPQTKPQYEVVR